MYPILAARLAQKRSRDFTLVDGHLQKLSTKIRTYAEPFFDSYKVKSVSRDIRGDVLLLGIMLSRNPGLRGLFEGIINNQRWVPRWEDLLSATVPIDTPRDSIGGVYALFLVSLIWQ